MPQKPLKIAQVIASKGWGGREKVPLLFAREYLRLGHQVSLWTNPETPLGQETLAEGFPLFPYRFRSYLNPAAFFEIARALREDKPDILHVHHSRDLWFLVPMLRLKGWKGPLLLSKHVESGVSKKDPIHRFLYARVDQVLGCSTMIRENVIKTCPVDPAKVAVGYAPVDPDRFKYSEKARRSLRRAWGQEKNIVIGMVARLTPGKGQELLLKTAAILRAKHPRLRFRVAGQSSPDEKDYAEGLLRLRKQLGLEDIFEYEGYRSDVPGFLSALDLAVHAAPAESFGLAIVEAMACERAVVARRGGGVSDILENPTAKKFGGFLIDSDDPEEWARKLAPLVRSPRLLQKIGKANRKESLRFSLKALSRLNMDYYEKLLKARPR
ncbi:MAG TPA: glycosyltransferase family 4 protein [bacterium]|nr:glycosyltransferase family 4 protein [bacterium]